MPPCCGRRLARLLSGRKELVRAGAAGRADRRQSRHGGCDAGRGGEAARCAAEDGGWSAEAGLLPCRPSAAIASLRAPRRAVSAATATYTSVTSGGHWAADAFRSLCRSGQLTLVVRMAQAQLSASASDTTRAVSPHSAILLPAHCPLALTAGSAVLSADLPARPPARRTLAAGAQSAWPDGRADGRAGEGEQHAARADEQGARGDGLGLRALVPHVAGRGSGGGLASDMLMLGTVRVDAPCAGSTESTTLCVHTGHCMRVASPASCRAAPFRRS